MKRLLILPLLLLLAGCVPFVQRTAVDALNEVTGSHGVLSYATPGIRVTPGETILLHPRLDVQGTDLATIDPACTVLEEATLVRCHWLSLTDVTTVTLTGLDVTAAIAYLRPGDRITRIEHLGYFGD